MLKVENRRIENSKLSTKVENKRIENSKLSTKVENKRIENSKLSTKVERKQTEFDEYINGLPFTERCKYMSGVLNIVDFCDNTTFYCKFRKKETYKHKGRELYECERERVKKIKQLLGSNF